MAVPGIVIPFVNVNASALVRNNLPIIELDLMHIINSIMILYIPHKEIIVCNWNECPDL